MLNINQIKTGKTEDSEYVVPYSIHYVQNGVSKTWDLVKSHSSVSIVIYNITRESLVCVKQFRPGVYLNSVPEADRKGYIDVEKYPPHLGITLEFCAGIVDKNKPLKVIAAEEVFEECGYKVDPCMLEVVQTFRCSVGTSGDYQTMYYLEVDDSMKVNEGGGVDSELIEVVDISHDEGKQLLTAPSPSVPGEFLYGLLWFYHSKYPRIEKKNSGVVT